MEFHVAAKGKNELTLEIDEADDTLLYTLITRLLEDADVSEAKYAIHHPQLDKPTLYLRTKKGKPKTALKRAAESLAKDFAEARGMVEKEFA